ncbi:hypothetical protein BDF22DRAFT_689549 [Syncephalis plumigaleata]|nr:hypothetical protein BDF22DRAFT_689549 [Syncephalis plumigaleata]
MYLAALSIILCLHLFIVFSQAFNYTYIHTIESYNASVICNNFTSRYVQYLAKANSNGLTAVYLSPMSNAMKYISFINSERSTTTYAIEYDELNSCTTNNQFNKEKNGEIICEKGNHYTYSDYYMKTLDINEPYCILLDNTGNANAAKVNVTFQFVNNNLEEGVPEHRLHGGGIKSFELSTTLYLLSIIMTSLSMYIL